MSRFGATLCICMLASGCAPWGTHADTRTTCERGFAKDPDWNSVAQPGSAGRRVWREFPGFEFEGVVVHPRKSSTLWFRNKVNQEVAACSMHSCESGRCVWRIRLFTKQSGRWQLRSSYDIGKARAELNSR